MGSAAIKSFGERYTTAHLSNKLTAFFTALAK